MPKRDPETPIGVRTYIYHGVDFHKREGTEWVGTCPFCDKDKFHVNSETSLSDCKVCQWQAQYPDDGVTGNNYGFLKYLWRVSYDATKLIDYGWLSAHRKLPAEALREWGVCKSVTTGEWIVPAYGVKDPPNITQIYKYVNLKGSYALLPTPGFAEGESHGILLPRVFSGNSSDRVYVCEGLWDGITLSNVLRLVDENKDGSSNKGMDASILAVPGCGVFRKDWVQYTDGKDVVLLYDNDYPHINEKTKTITQASFTGTKHTTNIIGNGAKSVSWLDWNGDGKGYTDTLPDKYDVRDWLAKDGKPLDDLFALVKLVPKEWLTEKVSAQVKERIQCKTCTSWKVMTDTFRLAAKWTPELHGAMAVSLSCACSINGIGEPLWVRLISPPSTYKSQLCKAIGTNEHYTIMDDGMTGFYSGMQTDDGSDYSLVTKWNGKCLITKEGSTLFTNSNSEQIIGEARAIYDGEVDRRWKNGKHVSHRDWRGTWLLAGTPNMKDYDDNELGPRFIDYRIVKDVTEELELDIITRAMNEQNEAGIANCKAGSGDNPDYLKARQLCGGYLEYLRKGIDTHSLPLISLPQSYLVKIGSLSMFIEKMRGRPSRNYVSENVEAALAARVSKQLVKLARFLCVVMQRSTVDDSVMNIVYKVAMDTSDGWSQEFVTTLMESSRDGDEGLEPLTLCKRTKKEHKEVEKLLGYLQQIKVLEMYIPTNMPSPVRQGRLRLTNSFRTLYNAVKRMSYELQVV